MDFVCDELCWNQLLNRTGLSCGKNGKCNVQPLWLAKLFIASRCIAGCAGSSMPPDFSFTKDAPRSAQVYIHCESYNSTHRSLVVMRYILTAIVTLASLAQQTCALTYRAADISSVAVVEQQGIHFTDNGQTKPFEDIMTAHGGNTARIRVWTAGQYNLQYALAMGKRVKAAGMTLVIDLHFSDTCKCSNRSSS